MKKAGRYVLYSLTALVLVVVVLITVVKTTMPDVGDPENISVESTPERIERGRYLANNVMVCMDCHSARDWTKFSGPLVDGT